MTGDAHTIDRTY